MGTGASAGVRVLGCRRSRPITGTRSATCTSCTSASRRSGCCSPTRKVSVTAEPSRDSSRPHVHRMIRRPAHRQRVHVCSGAGLALGLGLGLGVRVRLGEGAVCEARRAQGRVGAGQRRRLTSPLITPRKSVAGGGTGAGTVSRTALPELALVCSRSSSSRSVPGCEAMRSPSAPHSCALALPSTPPERKDETSRRSWSWSHAWYQLSSRQETGEVG